MIPLLIWAVIIGVAFAYCWRKGYLLQLTNYIQQTREELRKCTWPTWDELKGSTVLITITICLMGGFVRVVDMVLVFILLQH